MTFSIVAHCPQTGKIGAATATGGRNGFNCESVFLSDRNNAGFGTKDTFNFSFALPAGWSENLIVVKPNFNPLTDL